MVKKEEVKFKTYGIFSSVFQEVGGIVFIALLAYYLVGLNETIGYPYLGVGSLLILLIMFQVILFKLNQKRA